LVAETVPTNSFALILLSVSRLPRANPHIRDRWSWGRAVRRVHPVAGGKCSCASFQTAATRCLLMLLILVAPQILVQDPELTLPASGTQQCESGYPQSGGLSALQSLAIQAWWLASEELLAMRSAWVGQGSMGK
jgi:hypothetical protein